MVKRVLLLAVSFVFVLGLSVAAQSDKGKSYTGTITDTMCGGNHGAADARDCTITCVKEHGAKLALYVPATKKVYVLDPQSKITGHEGHHVTIMGTVDADGKTLHVDSLKMVAEKPKAAGQ